MWKVLVIVVQLVTFTSALSFLSINVFGSHTCDETPPTPRNGACYRVTPYISPVRCQCDAGFVLRGRRYNYCINGSWALAAPPRCIRTTRRGCTGSPPRIRYGRSIPIFTSLKARYICNRGYDLVGDRDIYCVNGSWNSSSPTCVFDYCRRQPCARNAFCISGDGSYTCRCRPRYIGDGKKSCQRVCDPPRPIRFPHVTYSPEKAEYTEQERITYECEDGYQAVRNRRSQIICTDGTFRSVSFRPYPRCRKTPTCQQPTAPSNGQFQPTNKENWEIGDEVTYECDETFMLLGSNIATCQSDGTYDNHRPRCVAMCPAPDTPVNGAVEPSGRPFFLSGDEVLYSCYGGTILVGSEVATCTDDHAFEPGTPSCVSARGASESSGDGESK